MTTSAGSNNLLATDGGVIDHSGSVYVVGRALAGLVVARKAPREDLSVGGDGEAVISTSGDSDDVLVVWNDLR